MKKSKSFLFLFAIGLMIISLFLINYFSAYYKPETVEDTLGKYFTFSKAKVLSSEIYFWGSIKANNDSLEELKKLALNFSNDIGVTESNVTSNKINNSELMQQVELNGNLKKNCSTTEKEEAKVCIKVERQENENTISVNITQDLTFDGLNKLNEKVHNVFQKHGIKPHNNSCIIGFYNKKMNAEEMNAVCKSIINQAEGKKVEGMQDQNLVSMAAFSPMIDDSTIVNGKHVNLSLAMRYNSIENKTYLWLATPVITIEY